MTTLRSLIILSVWLLGCVAPEKPSDQDPPVRLLLGDDRYEWVTIRTLHTRIHFPVGSYAQTHQSILPDRAEDARRIVLDRLSVADYGETLDVFYVDGRDDMANLTGTPVTGYSYFNDNALIVVFNEEWRAFERHELTHTVTLGTWPEAHGAAAVEGLATFVDGDCGGFENGRVLRSILALDGLIPLGLLEADFRGQDDLIAYLQAGSIFEFTVQGTGASAIRHLWDRGLQASAALLEIPSERFQTEFEGWVFSTYDPIPTESLNAIRTGGCGIDSRPGVR